MATIRFYLDERRAKANGEYPVKIAVFHRKDIMFSTGISASKNEWANGVLNKKASNYKTKNAKLSLLKSNYENILFDLERSNKLNSMSDAELKIALSAKKSANESSFFTVFEQFIETRTAEKTREIYSYTLAVVREFDNSATFETINRDWLHRFELHLSSRGMAINSISIHLRNVRAVFNYALDNETTSSYPFRKFKIKHEKTMHKDADMTELRRIMAYEGKFEAFRDFFMLSFFLIGMNMKDMLYLKQTDLRKGRLTYRRMKTNTLYDIKVEPEAAELIEKYKGKDEFLLDFIHMYKDYEGFKRGVNYALKKLSDEGGVINDKLSTYYARHTWATIAASLDIPKETISAALGHSIGSEITSIYINFDKKKVDEANRRVIDSTYSFPD